MNFKLRFLVSSVLFCTSICCAFANGVVARVTDPGQISSIVADYPMILGYDEAGSSPFVRFEARGENVDSLELLLRLDTRIVWVEEEDSFDAPENQSGHGSSVAAIYDRTASFAQNNNLWKQINFGPLFSRVAPIKVGIVDTGVSPLQPSILARIVASANFVPGSTTIDDYPTNIDTNQNGIFDEGAGHGTMIAGLILQMSPTTPLVIAKSADSDGIATSWSVLKGVVFCIEHGSRVINVSLGSPNHLVGFSDFLDWVTTTGSVVVSPIGNNGLEMTLYPAGYSAAICVSGVLPDNTKAPFSNWDPSARISAPATGIQSAWYDGKTAIWSGTSFSAPLVTASIAMALTTFPNSSPSEIRRAVTTSGKNIDNLNPDYRGKIGRLLDFRNLINSLRK